MHDYENLLSTWINLGNDFDVSNVRDALSAFTRNISPSHKKVFDKIFVTLETGLSKLGDTSGAQTKAIKELIRLIDDIPMDGKQGYDVLGFIYEYLISNFAANAGKKAGEFYTPHEVCKLMSEIVANHLSGRDKIEIYDPTSGSGSLLITIGKSVGKYVSDENQIKYYAQELKDNTYNLTRMNLVMRGILPDNIVARCGDTLAEDWPFFDEDTVYSPLYVDAVVSNPPYSIHWAGDENPVLINDPRYSPAGVLAPKTKADFAFIMHSLAWLAPSGSAAIVCFPGIMYRGGAEQKIRKYLIDNNFVDCVIQLPENLFFGTSIATNIMVLKKNRPDTGILFIDASREFVKVTNNNKLTDENIGKIVDTFVSRSDSQYFSRVVPYDEVCEQEYNLSVSTYVEKEDTREVIDIKKLNAEIAEIVAREDVLRREIDVIVAEIEGKL